ncbi:carotenoid isomerooxygenase isoform X3 [Rhopalosiphum maidis]|uniref:carotenoid isomerooxygenase isoform X3 n=1 Tax=Rhopalosiphum maidis TaxID=43146 RepID=UPI000EFE27D1|nr:carotenoid isomerooxygenase isoform X3 [Rhopalosiphum maidis]
MKKTTRYFSKKKYLLKTILTSKVKSTIDRYKKCRFWLSKGLWRVANNWKETAPVVSGQTAGIDSMFRGLDENRDLLVKRLNAGQDLYPNCDTSIWLRNCTHDIPIPVQGKIRGKIPEWLSGSLLRNGPGSTHVGNYEFNHIFDSSALLHRFAFKNGLVSYQCRFLESNTYKQNKAAQRIVITEFGTKACPDPCKTIFHSGYQYSTDEIFGQMCIVATIKCRWPLHPGYMHSFGITEHYFVVVEQPLSISLSTAMINRFKGNPISSALKWFQDCPTLIYLISRSNGKMVKTFKSDAFFYLHIINQYEEDDNVVIDICCYRDPSMIDCMFVEALQNLNKNPDYAAMFRSRPLRFVLPVNRNPTDGDDTNEQLYVCPEKLCDLGCETPRINDLKIGKNYRFFYAISSDVDAENPGTLIKVDTYNKTCKTWCEKNVYPSEPIFVSSPDAEDEDDGVILSSIIWGGSECTHQAGVIVLDAKSWTEIGRAIFITQSPVPKCLHGWYAAAV